MKAEIFLWTACIFSLPNDLPRPENWQQINLHWEYRKSAWTIRLELAFEEEVPPQIAEKNEHVKHLYVLTLEKAEEGPIGQGEIFLQEVAKNLLFKCDNTVLDSPGHPIGPLVIDSQVDPEE